MAEGDEDEVAEMGAGMRECQRGGGKGDEVRVGVGGGRDGGGGYQVDVDEAVDVGAVFIAVGGGGDGALDALGGC